MKNVFVSLVAIITLCGMQLCGTKAMATNIDEATARQYGAYYLSVMTGSSMAESSQITLAYTFMNKDLNIPAAYVFNIEKQGFVIVSGSDLWYPILGYSTEGLLDTNKMAPSFKWYFEGLCGYIIYSQNTDKPLIEGIDEEWAELKYQKLPAVKNVKAQYWLMDNEWGQGSSVDPTYNKLCPHKVKDGYDQTAYVGCVATAMSQIMHFWKYPVEPVEDYLGYSCYLDGSYYAYLEVDMSEVVYDYDNMPNKLTSTSTDAEIDATALLCYHAGVSVEMGYGLDGSGAHSEDVPAAMRDVFLYDESLEMLSRAKNFNGVSETPIYSNDEWIEILSKEIEAGRPMYYSGYSVSGTGRDAGGHAFVCDGKHPSNNKFHFNWGWDGQPNVWSDVRNNDLAANGYDFKFDQDVIIKLAPKGQVGIAEVEEIKSSVYPNPATTKVTISYQLTGEDCAVLSVYSVDGRMMESVKLETGSNRVVLDVSHYAKGLYIYRIGSKVQKFVVE